MGAIVFLVLLIWVVWLTVRTGELRNRLQALERRLAQAPVPAGRQALDDVEAVLPPRSEPVPPPPATPLAPLPELDPTPAWPDVPAPPVRPAPALAAEPRAARSQAAAEASRAAVAQWLSENGLAWVGGAVLALGGLFLVSYAAQRGVFTPALRIAAAAAVGFLLLGVSEWLRRQAERETRGHRLAAAAAAGAGAATLYAAVWASYWLYGFIGLGPAAALLGVVSFGLLGLGFRHGEPLAILAIGGALLAPVVTGPQQWAAPALTGYLALVVTTGFGTAGERRWGAAGFTTLAGAALWALAGYAAEGYVRVAALAVGPLALAVVAAEWRRRVGDPPVREDHPDPFSWLPTGALIAAALLLAPLWALPLRGPELAATGVGAILLMALTALAAERRLVTRWAQLAAWASALAVALTFGLALGRPASVELWAGAVALATAVAGAWVAVRGRDEAERLFAGAAALAVLLIAFAGRGALSADAPWAPPALAALLLGLAAAAVARRSADPRTDLTLAVWIWCAAAGLLWALRLASEPRFLPVATAVASAAFALLHARIGWRGFAASAIAAALATLAALLTPEILRPLFAGRLPVLVLGPVVAVAAALIFGGARLVREKEPASPTADALSTGAMLVALTGAFLLLRLWAEGTGEGRLDPFLEASLRTLLLLAAGLLMAQGVRPDSHPIGRWRGHAFLLAGALHAVLIQALALNPLVADWQPAVSGPPLLDSLAVGFLAPALLLAFATRRRVTAGRGLLAAYAGVAALLASLWGVEEIRRLFQGPTLDGGRDVIGRAEVAAYAVALLLGARLLDWTAVQAGLRTWTISPIADLVRRVAGAGGWSAVVFAGFVFGYAASPWWGPLDRPLDGLAATALLFGLYAAGAAVLLWLVRMAEAAGQAGLGRAARICAVLTVFAFLTLVVRLGFHGYDMRPSLREASLETWAFSAAWGLYGFALLVFAAARREADLRWAGLVVLLATTAKIFLFDMARLEGVVRAGSFLAVGALLLAAAVLARRLSGDGSVLGFGRKPAAEG